jgi:starch synthase (maltosyl-transferring)
MANETRTRSRGAASKRRPEDPSAARRRRAERVSERLMIEAVTPSIDDGRYPIKRIVGDVVSVGADLYTDGHGLIAGRIRYRGPGSRGWRTSPLAYEYDPDRWFGRFEVDRIGRWEFSIEAWPDPWAGWRADLRKRVAAGQDVASELLEGAQILRQGARHLENATELESAAARLADARSSPAERAAFALDDAAGALVQGPVEPRALARREPPLTIVVDRERAGFGAWYEFFPRSESPEPGRHGTFSDAERRLPEIAELGFDVVYLPPIHPIGRSFRKGPNNTTDAGPNDVGSPWAIGAEEGGHKAVHPELGSLEDFEHFVERARELDLEVALDFALQCSPDHPWVKEHPEWFFVRPDGSIRYAENPPKKYQDIYPINFWCENRDDLWLECLDTLLFWIDRGVRIFRVDNPHTKPLHFWEWIIAEVQREHPDVIFLAEAFTRPKRMKGLAKLGFTQSYTYFTWKNTSWELREYLDELSATDMVEYYRPNFFANTPDILHEYLQTGGRPAFRARLLLAGTLSPVYGIYSGFELCENVALKPGSEEYLDSEKYQIRQRDYDAPGNIEQDIRTLNRIRREQPALRSLDNLRFYESSNERILWYGKLASGQDLFVAVNLDPFGVQEAIVQMPIGHLGIAPYESYEVEDLLSGERYRWQGERNYVRLDPKERPGHVLRVRREEGAS